MKPPAPFVAIVDKGGEVYSTLPRGASMREVETTVSHADKMRSWGAPHSAWLWNGAVWYHFKLP